MWSDATDGKNCICQDDSTAQIVILLQNLTYSCTLSVIQQFQMKIFNYIWGSKGNRLAQAAMYASKDLGALGGPRLSKILCSSATNPIVPVAFQLL